MNLAAAFSPKIKLGVEGRTDLLEKIESSFANLTQGRQVAWFHSASLGEFEQGRPVIEAFRKEYPEHFILLTFFSPSGYEIRKNYQGADFICYLPIDTASNAQRFVQTVQPQIAFFIKYEFWFNYLKELRKSEAVIFSFSTIFRKEQIFFKPFGGFYKNLLRYFDQILVQNIQSLELLKDSGLDNCSLAGDTRFDRVKSIADQVQDLPVIAKFVGSDACLIAGSVWDNDMLELIPAFNGLGCQLKIIIAPHEIKKDEIEEWRNKLSASSTLYSQYKDNPASQSFDILIIDNIGMLSSLYRYGSIAYIGGAFGAGLHNILEAATFGLPIMFGNKTYDRFQEAKDLIARKGAFSVSDSSDIKRLLSDWCNNPQSGLKIGDINKEYVLSQTGATDKVMREVNKFLR